METICTIKNAPVNKEVWGNEAKAWSDRADFFIELHEKKERKEQVMDFLAYVKKHALLPPQGSACDIGCGVGDYALGLAQEGYTVSAIDLAPGMVAGAKSLAEKMGIRLDLNVGPWSEETRQFLGWEHSFDLSYSIFCPVMHGREQLAALTKASRSKCLLLAFANRKDAILDAVMPYFYEQDTYNWQQAMDDTLMHIAELGNNVTVEYRDMVEEERFTLNESIRYFSLRLFNEDDADIAEKKEKLKELLQAFMDGDTVVNRTVDTVAWVTWDSPR